MGRTDGPIATDGRHPREKSAAGGLAALPRVDILGVKVSAITMSDALLAIAGWIARRQAHYVCVTPAHGVMECRDDPELRAIFNASGLTTPDGMSIVWLLRLRGYARVERVYGPDLMLAVCGRSIAEGWRHFLFGGEEGVAALLAERLLTRFPELQIAGTLTPPFRAFSPDEDEELVRAINAARPDVVWVGLSTPNQERWMAAHLRRLTAPVLVGVGAAFDFLSGRKPQAPRWMQRRGLEWLFRLATEPRRLAPRYAKYPLFAALALRQAVQTRRPARRDARPGP
jgi:N-acetylglucosaminyldiphosphoundecaprenol N-acetyl-beta-D-mannosaminyltransferase